LEGSATRWILWNILLPTAVVALLYLAAGAAMLRFRLDSMLWPRSPSTVRGLPPATFSTLDSGGNGAIARRVGPETARCVVFFPGRHGGFLRYSRDLFPSLNAAGLTVWAVSYAGQDGASGESTRSTVFADVDQILQVVERQCPQSHTVFLGRSLGATVAAVAASRWHPNGLVLEGAGVSLAAAVRRELSQHWYFHALEVLPVESLIGTDYPLEDYLRRYGLTRTVMFEGERDDIAPVSDLQHLAHLGVRLEVVPGATHTNTYQLVGHALPDTLAALTSTPPVSAR
jgi:Serine aminopeptidase, S33